MNYLMKDHQKQLHPMEETMPYSIMQNESGMIEHSDLFERHRKLVKWVTQENDGYLHPGVSIAHSQEKGFHMVVAEGQYIQALTRITSSPMSTTLSVLNAFNVTPFSSHGTQLPPLFLKRNTKKPEALQTFFLMEQQVQGDKSWWAPYIRTLPTPSDIEALQFDSQADQAWLEGTNLKSAILAQTSKWQEMYTKGLRELKVLSWKPALEGRYTWALFRWAATIFGSRSFTSEVLTDTEPADQARMEGRNGVKVSEHDFLKPLFMDRFAVLLPLLDILNHRPVAQVEWQARCSFVGMQVLSSFTSGEELCNNYGPRDNEGLLLSYGFTIPSNPFDHVAIALKHPPPGSPLSTARNNWHRDQRSTPEYRPYIFNISHPHASASTASCLESALYSYDLLDALSILKSNDRELQTMHAHRQTLMSSCLSKPHKFPDFRCLLATLSQLYLDCKARAERLSSTQPRESQPKNQKQRYAKVYRDSQLSIVETATAVCAYVLARACCDRSEDEILAEVEEKTNWAAFANLKTLLREHGVTTKRNELLSVEKILESLPEDSVKEWKDVMAEIQSCLRPPEVSPLLQPSKTNINDGASPPTPATLESRPQNAPNPSTEPLALTKTHFATLLSLSLHLYLSGHSLPLRLNSWLAELTSWYPPDDPNWSYVPHAGPWSPSEEPPESLVMLLAARQRIVSGMGMRYEGSRNAKQWLKPERLCWGWNVMEEEGVVVSTDITGLAEGREKTQSEVEFLLYCKQ